MGLYIQMHSMHGLFRGHHLELGRDEDTGGQILYVRYLARELAKLPEVDRVDIITRRIIDPEYPGYDQRVEPVSEGVDIVRIECGPEQYIKKVDLWPYIDEFVENCRRYIENEAGRKPDILHSNYADSGLVCARLSRRLGIPQVHTGHSLGKPKMERLGVTDANYEEFDRQYHFSARLAAEQEAIDNASAIVVSTDEERLYQYSMYAVCTSDPRFRVIPPGVNLEKFYPTGTDNLGEWDAGARKRLREVLAEELAEPDRPMIFSISRLDYRKNLISLVKAYALDEELPDMANLVLVTGSLGKMGKSQQRLMDEMVSFIEEKSLTDRFCVIRHLEYKTEGGEIYRLVYDSGGVFVNPAFHEPFGITVVEAAASGLPVVATNNGGPVEILGRCECGELVDPRHTKEIAAACRKLLTDRDLWREYSRRARERVVKYYSWENTAVRECALFQEILAGEDQSAAAGGNHGNTDCQPGRQDADLYTG